MDLKKKTGTYHQKSLKNASNHNKAILSLTDFNHRLAQSLQFSPQLTRTVCVAQVELDHLQNLEKEQHTEALYLVDHELTSELHMLLSPTTFIGKIKNGSYLIASLGMPGRDYEFISKIEFLRRHFERKVIRPKNEGGHSPMPIFFKFTLSAGIASSEAQKTQDAKTLTQFSHYALTSSQTKGSNLIRAASTS